MTLVSSSGLAKRIEMSECGVLLSFLSAMAYWEHASDEPLRILASTEYDGTNFETANWTEISANIANSSDDNYAWVESGDISLSSFVG